MAPEDNSWIPQGTHEVQIGPSLNKALKARKGGPPPQVKRTGPPEKDFYSFRYNRKPPSLDTTKPGTIEVSRGKDTTTVVVEHPSSQPGESHVYTGTVRTETSAKELDCVLIYDEETGFYKLEKLESYIGLNYDRKTIACKFFVFDAPCQRGSNINSGIHRIIKLYPLRLPRRPQK
ncbi:RNA polymerase II transcription elongation factor-domain-containing protein [Mycena haematopus]|nr:RNA polymerase II transcription elongation factor-domain-containing protein [Mycena haematopus]